MRKSILALAFLLSSTAQAQGVNNYIPDIMTRVPDGASGPGIVYTQRTTGKIIGIGAPIYRNFPVGQECQQDRGQAQYDTAQQHSSVNVGSVLGTLVGGIVGSKIGAGDGQLVATAVGAGTGALVGNNINRSMERDSRSQGFAGGCQTTYEQRIVGYSFTAQYASLQMQGFMARQPRLGEDVEIIIRSVFYAGN